MTESDQPTSPQDNSAGDESHLLPDADDAAQGDFDDFDDGVAASPTAMALVVDVEGYEGPLDVLLILARSQKVDLKKISILALVDQYLAFVGHARRFNLELAADYLVMAAWLAYLKSKLLLPKVAEDGEEPTGEELAARLQFRLQRLHAMREAGARLMARDRLGRDVFVRGCPENVRLIRKPRYEASLFDLLKSYADQRVRAISHESYKMARAPVFAVELARKRLERLFGRLQDWNALDNLLPVEWLAGSADDADRKRRRRSATASTFLASLEMTKEGKVEIRQLTTFGPIYLRRKAGGGASAAGPL